MTNQRETAVVWDRRTGRPFHNAIVWQDTRTDSIAKALDADGRGDVIRHKAGLPPATYFSAGKVQWMLENVDGLRDAAERGDALFGTPDTWVVWNLTGGPDGGVHATDVTNASRTMLMDLTTLDWDDELLGFFGIPRAMLPTISASSDAAAYGTTTGARGGRRRCRSPACSATSRRRRWARSASSPARPRTPTAPATSCCSTPVRSWCAARNGLLTTVAYQLGDARPVYALEGSIAVTGSAVQWLRDQLGIISGASEVETLAASVEDTGGVYFVPAFSGLFAPYWRSDARGAIVGLSRFNTNAHLARATLEAICYQSRDVVDAMAADSGVALTCLKVDGGITANRLCMQLQADVLGVPVSQAGRARDHRARCGVRRRARDRLLVRHRRAAHQVGRGRAVGAAVERRPAPRRVCRVAQGRAAHPGLGGRRVGPGCRSASCSPSASWQSCATPEIVRRP